MSQIKGSQHWRYKVLAADSPPALHVDCHQCDSEILVSNGVMHGGRVIGRITCQRRGCGWQDFVQLDGFDELVELGGAKWTRHR